MQHAARHKKELQACSLFCTMFWAAPAAGGTGTETAVPPCIPKLFYAMHQAAQGHADTFDPVTATTTAAQDMVQNRPCCCHSFSTCPKAQRASGCFLQFVGCRNLVGHMLGHSLPTPTLDPGGIKYLKTLVSPKG